MAILTEVTELLTVVNQMSPDARWAGILVLILCCFLLLIWALILLIKKR